MPYERIVLQKPAIQMTQHQYIQMNVDKQFKFLWTSFKAHVRKEDYWHNVPQADVRKLAADLVGKLKTDRAKFRLAETAAGIHIIYDDPKGPPAGVVMGTLSSGPGSYAPPVAVPLQPDQKQAVFERLDGKEFVRDSYGQHVPRYVYRFITNYDEQTVDSLIGLTPRDPKATNTLLEHVSGRTYTQFISVTRSKKAIQNAHGEEFGKVKVKIDLSYLAEKELFDMSTPMGETTLLKEANKTTKDVDKASGQIKQALMDAKRTKEVLVRGGIPHEAIVEIMAENSEGKWQVVKVKGPDTKWLKAEENQTNANDDEEGYESD